MSRTGRSRPPSVPRNGPAHLSAAGLAVTRQWPGQPVFDTGRLTVAAPREHAVGDRERMDETEDTMRTVRDHRFRCMRNYHPDRAYAQHVDYVESFSTW